jgi:hypothetical protein
LDNLQFYLVAWLVQYNNSFVFTIEKYLPNPTEHNFYSLSWNFDLDNLYLHFTVDLLSTLGADNVTKQLMWYNLSRKYLESFECPILLNIILSLSVEIGIFSFFTWRLELFTTLGANNQLMGPNQVDTDRTAQMVLNPFLVAKERFP